MKKRRTRIKPRFWLILSTVIIIVSCLICNLTMAEETTQISEVVAEVEAPAVEEDYILDIPLSAELQTELYEASKEFGVDYYVMVALIDRETNFRNVMGDGGDSYGYCQIQPKWWYSLMTEIGATDLNTPKDNFRTACAIMARLTERYGSIEGALVAYNQGYYKCSTPYSREIIANANRYKA